MFIYLTALCDRKLSLLALEPHRSRTSTMPKIRGAAVQARRPRFTGQIDAISAASLNEQVDERLTNILTQRSQEGNAGVQTTASERLESWHTWLVSLFDNLLEVGGTPTWLLDLNMQQLQALTRRLDQVKAHAKILYNKSSSWSVSCAQDSVCLPVSWLLWEISCEARLQGVLWW